MADKIFGVDFADDNAPAGTWTLSIHNGTALRDVQLAFLHKALSVPGKISGNSVAPTANDDSDDGYRSGDIWLDASHNIAYIAVDVTPAAAVWYALFRKNQTLTDGASVDWDMGLGSDAVWTMAGSRTLNAPTYLKAGGIYTLKVIQDGTGGRVITFNSVFKFTPQPNLAASSVTEYMFVSDGTSLFCVGKNPANAPGSTVITSSATPTFNTDQCNFVDITALAAAITSMTSGLSGTPFNGQKLVIRIKDNGTARAITWGASYESCGVALPTTTVISKRLTVGFIYDTTTSKWGCVASAQEA